MREIVVVSGTATGIGKTYVAARLLDRMRSAGLSVAARKPVQSFDPQEQTTDAEVLAAASGDETHAVCPPHRRYPLAMAPPMAAEALGRPPFTVADLVEETVLPDTGLVLVEGVGGPRSPVAVDGDTVDFADRLGATAVVLVASAGLGTLNDVLLAAPVFAPTPVCVILNRFDASDDLHRRNLEWLRRARLDVTTSVAKLSLHWAPDPTSRASGSSPLVEAT